jgi:plastocyanin
MKSIRYSFFAALLMLLVSNLQAKTWDIYFGGENGSPAFGYEPNAIPDVTVGDQIVWHGAFGSHPLTMMVAPDGAEKPAHITTSDPTYTYTVTVAGDYGYVCDFHGVSNNMVGGFRASASGGSGVTPQANNTLKIESLFPNPANATNIVSFELSEAAHVKLLVFDANGKLAMTALDENMGAGPHSQTIDTKQFASGSYQYVLQAGDAVLRRQAIIVR